MRAITRLARALLSPEAQWRIHQHRHLLKYGRSPQTYECNICGFTGYFRPQGWPVRPEALCPVCHSFERHRLLKLWLDANPIFGDVLHFAPEKSLAGIVAPATKRYVKADIGPRKDCTPINIERIELQDQSFDVIICNHILEHVDDLTALKELHRVLRPGGTLIVTTPIIETWQTYEDSSITCPRDREQHFGQHDHRRYYGADLRDRITNFGFTLTEFTGTPAQILRYGLMRGETIFIAKSVEVLEQGPSR